MTAALFLFAFAGDAYVGSAVCAGCHQEIAAAQSRSRMALTWQGLAPDSLPRTFDKRTTEGTVRYRLRRAGGRFLWGVALPGRPPFEAPVEAIVGGRRHGLSFLARVAEIEGEKLERPALVETRFLEGANAVELVLSPGFPLEQPASWETAVGHALSPSFETRCLGCHGLPEKSGKIESGVRCESCHGPGRDHVAAVARGAPRSGIVNPRKLDPGQRLELCGRCHSGFRKHSNPLPEELLISSQVVSLRNTECFKQGGGNLSCASCHDPHRDARENEAAYVAACRGCHGLEVAKHAAICPVNQKDGCIGCHMPRQTEGGFHMVDHWIRARPGGANTSANTALRSQVVPTTAFLRLIVVADQARADELRNRLAQGAGFYELAVQHSTDPSAANGGYLGEMRLDELNPVLSSAAAGLRYGEVSPVLRSSSNFMILGRMPREFRYRAAELQREAEALRAKGDMTEAANRCREALRLYPAFLRALFFMAAAQEQLGEAAQAAALLQYAAQLYPEDAQARFNLGVAYGSMGDMSKAIDAYRRTLDLDPDFVSAYLNLGAALFSADRLREAAGVLRDGLRINPLSAPLYYSLGRAEQQQGNSAAAKRALSLAGKIDPQFVRSQQPQ